MRSSFWTLRHHGIVIVIRRKTRAAERSALFRLLERAGKTGAASVLFCLATVPPRDHDSESNVQNSKSQGHVLVVVARVRTA